MATAKVPVTKRALIQRINRAIKEQDEQVRAPRGEKARQELGDFFRVNFRMNAVVEKGVDLVALGRELKVLQPWEQLAG